MEYRPYYLSREWIKAGHKVTIVAASMSHVRSQQPVINGDITEENIDGIRYIWVKTPEYYGNGIGRVINMAYFSIRLFVLNDALISDNKPDIVIASSPHPFIIYGAQRIARTNNAKLVFEVRDLWPLTLTELGDISKWHPFVLFMQLTENFAYRISDRIISLLPKADIYMKEHGMAPEKFFYLPNGLDVAEWKKSTRNALPKAHVELLNQLKQQGNFIVGYAGSHGISNVLHYLIDAADMLRAKPIAIVLVGKGPEKDALQNKALELGLKNVFFLPAVAKAAIPALLNLMDALYIGWQKKSLYKFGISPNKLLDYMMAAKPIIHAVDTENDIVAQSGCGISVPPEDPVAIANAIIQLMNMTPDKRKEIGLRGKEYVLAHHDYKFLAKRFLEIIQ
ncbi:MAG: glycosyltransferase family 4 protein [Cytophagaceae bacterium]